MQHSLSLWDLDNQWFSGQPTAPNADPDTMSLNPEPTGAPPGAKTLTSSLPQVYGGPIRFYRLATTLHDALNSLGYRSMVRNVVFPVSNLKSASVIFPMACEMARWNRNKVHVAIMGREDIPMEDLLEINGVDKEKCTVFWHDARPDYTEYSSEERAEATVASALGHIHNYIRPQAIVTDDSLSEDPFFTRGIRRKAKQLELPVIEIPKDRQDDLMWMTRLDAHSLRSWHKPSIDILVRAPTHSSGSLIRLLKSIQTADYSGLKHPRLTIEVPPELDVPTKEFLEKFVWPPASPAETQSSNLLIIRRRIANQKITQEEASIRFLESFYPASAKDSHVLLLSPQAQLSPLYYHYTMYSLLQFKYPLYDPINSELLMGISLELPTTLLDGKTPLKSPSTADMTSQMYWDKPGVTSVPFLWHAPNSHAALYFGDKWVELHSFLSNRVAKQHSSAKPVSPRKKLVSETLPAWTEYMLELMRARGFSLLYPARSSSEALVTVHNELYQLPEEFEPRSGETKGKDADIPPPELPKEAFLTADIPPPPPENHESPLLPVTRPLHLALPFDGDLPELVHLPLLDHTGAKVSQVNITITAKSYATEFREEVGGCGPPPPGKLRKIVEGSARDLFCFGEEGEDEQWWVDEVKDEDDDWDPFGLKAAKNWATNVAGAEATATVSSISLSPKVTAAAEPREDI